MRSDQASLLVTEENPYLASGVAVSRLDWKVTELPKQGDFRRSGADDQAAQLIIAFSSSRFLSYIWDSTAPKGMIASAPAPLFKKNFCRGDAIRDAGIRHLDHRAPQSH